LKTSREAADNKARAIVDDLRASKMAKAADLVEQAVHETLTYYGFPDIHWQKIRTNNPLERIMKEIRRRTASSVLSPASVLPGPLRVHRRHNMVGQMLHEHTTLSAGPI
jgi:transposase-like protein